MDANQVGRRSTLPPLPTNLLLLHSNDCRCLSYGTLNNEEGLMVCQQRAALLQKYRAAATVYAELVKQLRGAVDADYDLLQKRVVLAREKLAATQENLHLHLSTHHCSS